MEIKPTTDEYDLATKWRLPDGKLHRENGPAVEYLDGSKYWYRNGKLHREDGPAIKLADGDMHWFINGKHHRLDGPASIYVSEISAGFFDGNRDWWINDYCITDIILIWADEYNIDLYNLTEEDKFMIRLHWENYDGD